MVAAALQRARQRLLDARTPQGHWVGRLASSALSTATAISALKLAGPHLDVSRREQADLRVARGLQWLVLQQNPDGGWGDTDRSFSNIATTVLAIAAIRIAGEHQRYSRTITSAEQYVERHGLVEALRRRYGADKTFAVPILTNAALAGMVSWEHVPQLPFELACFPQSWYRYLRLPVVSYAIPALVAIGLVRHARRPAWFVPLRWLRTGLAGQALAVLQKMQPESGGFLEATPLTSFVVMSLVAAGRMDHPVVQRGVDFLLESVRPDGSWPIDTDLATWLTSLATTSLVSDGSDVGRLLERSCLQWLLQCQHKHVHPYTGAAPGGWGWSDRSGAVPDADDTPAALLALRQWYDSLVIGEAERQAIHDAVVGGLGWLLDLQNADGGWPTFCRGWGKLPFDRSGADLTAHALRAFKAWQPVVQQGMAASPRVTPKRIDQAVERGFRFLAKCQRRDGSWVPLWFGNQDDPAEENPVYGTARVLLAYEAWARSQSAEARRARAWLVANQRQDGSWGSGGGQQPSTTGSVEETSLALEALACHAPCAESVHRGARWLARTLLDEQVRAAPIGLYFAKLWYYEELYPWVFAVAGLGRLVRRGWLPEVSKVPAPAGQAAASTLKARS
ncbi:MAG: squalene--hopene cyclase [Pirellulaceae bacterium]|nr:MAG: squalene--hopene cyclase [Pirellulaceae bacterium]